MNHPNVVEFKDCIVSDKKTVNIVLEFLECGSLGAIVKNSGPLDEYLVTQLVKQILAGLKYIHSKNIIHRDIKGGNLLIIKSGTVKLADFGLAVLADNIKTHSLAGSPYWMAPEVIKEEDIITSACDIWSLGATIIELITTKPPYWGYDVVSATFSILNDDMPVIPDNITSNLKDFLMKCFVKDPKKRATINDLLKHTWITMPSKKSYKNFIKQKKEIPSIFGGFINDINVDLKSSALVSKNTNNAENKTKNYKIENNNNNKSNTSNENLFISKKNSIKSSFGENDCIGDSNYVSVEIDDANNNNKEQKNISIKENDACNNKITTNKFKNNIKKDTNTTSSKSILNMEITNTVKSNNSANNKVSKNFKYSYNKNIRHSKIKFSSDNLYKISLNNVHDNKRLYNKNNNSSKNIIKITDYKKANNHNYLNNLQNKKNFNNKENTTSSLLKGKVILNKKHKSLYNKNNFTLNSNYTNNEKLKNNIDLYKKTQLKLNTEVNLNYTITSNKEINLLKLKDKLSKTLYKTHNIKLNLNNIILEEYKQYKNSLNEIKNFNNIFNIKDLELYFKYKFLIFNNFINDNNNNLSCILNKQNYIDIDFEKLTSKLFIYDKSKYLNEDIYNLDISQRNKLFLNNNNFNYVKYSYIYKSLLNKESKLFISYKELIENLLMSNYLNIVKCVNKIINIKNNSINISYRYIIAIILLIDKENYLSNNTTSFNDFVHIIIINIFYNYKYLFIDNDNLSINKIQNAIEKSINTIKENLTNNIITKDKEIRPINFNILFDNITKKHIKEVNISINISDELFNNIIKLLENSSSIIETMISLCFINLFLLSFINKNTSEIKSINYKLSNIDFYINSIKFVNNLFDNNIVLYIVKISLLFKYTIVKILIIELLNLLITILERYKIVILEYLNNFVNENNLFLNNSNNTSKSFILIQEFINEYLRLIINFNKKGFIYLLSSVLNNDKYKFNKYCLNILYKYLLIINCLNFILEVIYLKDKNYVKTCVFYIEDIFNSLLSTKVILKLKLIVINCFELLKLNLTDINTINKKYCNICEINQEFSTIKLVFKFLNLLYTIFRDIDCNNEQFIIEIKQLIYSIYKNIYIFLTNNFINTNYLSCLNLDIIIKNIKCLEKKFKSINFEQFFLNYINNNTLDINSYYLFYFTELIIPDILKLNYSTFTNIKYKGFSNIETFNTISNFNLNTLNIELNIVLFNYYCNYYIKNYDYLKNSSNMYMPSKKKNNEDYILLSTNILNTKNIINLIINYFIMLISKILNYEYLDNNNILNYYSNLKTNFLYSFNINNNIVINKDLLYNIIDSNMLENVIKLLKYNSKEIRNIIQDIKLDANIELLFDIRYNLLVEFMLLILDINNNMNILSDLKLRLNNSIHENQIYENFMLLYILNSEKLTNKNSTILKLYTINNLNSVKQVDKHSVNSDLNNSFNKNSCNFFMQRTNILDDFNIKFDISNNNLEEKYKYKYVINVKQKATTKYLYQMVLEKIYITVTKCIIAENTSHKYDYMSDKLFQSNLFEISEDNNIFNVNVDNVNNSNKNTNFSNEFFILLENYILVEKPGLYSFIIYNIFNLLPKILFNTVSNLDKFVVNFMVIVEDYVENIDRSKYNLIYKTAEISDNETIKLKYNLSELLFSINNISNLIILYLNYFNEAIFKNNINLEKCLFEYKNNKNFDYIKLYNTFKKEKTSNYNIDYKYFNYIKDILCYSKINKLYNNMYEIINSIINNLNKEHNSDNLENLYNGTKHINDSNFKSIFKVLLNTKLTLQYIKEYLNVGK